METKIIEATNGFNWGKFCVARFDTEWRLPSMIPEEREAHGNIPILAARGWARDHVWVLDIETCEGAGFRPGGLASADLDKHRIWVCPLFEPFLQWLYKQDLTDLQKLPSVIELPNADSAMAGYRRLGPVPMFLYCQECRNALYINPETQGAYCVTCQFAPSMQDTYLKEVPRT